MAIFFIREFFKYLKEKKHNPDGEMATLIRQQETWVQAMRDGMNKIHERINESTAAIGKVGGKLDVLIQVGPTEVSSKLDALSAKLDTLIAFSTSRKE